MMTILGLLAGIISISHAGFEEDLIEYRRSSSLAAQRGISKYDHAFQVIKKADLFHSLYIDKPRLKNPTPAEVKTFERNPELLFDVREPGYAAAMTNAFDGPVRQNIDSQFTLETGIQFHDSAINGVAGEEAAPFRKGISPGFRYGVRLDQFPEGVGFEAQIFELFTQNMIDFDSFCSLALTERGTRRNTPLPSELRRFGPREFFKNKPAQFAEVFFPALKLRDSNDPKMVKSLLAEFTSAVARDAEIQSLSRVSISAPQGGQVLLTFESNINGHLEAYFKSHTPSKETRSYFLLREKYKQELAKIGQMGEDLVSAEDLERPELSKALALRKEGVEKLIQQIQDLVAHPNCQRDFIKVAQSRLKPDFKEFYKALSEGDDSRIIKATGKLLKKLEMYHIHPDGNQRTYAFLSLDKILIQHGLPPAVLEDPTIFDGFASDDTIARHIKKGIENFLELRSRAQEIQLSQIKTKVGQPAILDQPIFDSDGDGPARRRVQVSGPACGSEVAKGCEENKPGCSDNEISRFAAECQGLAAKAAARK